FPYPAPMHARFPPRQADTSPPVRFSRTIAQGAWPVRAKRRKAINSLEFSVKCANPRRESDSRRGSPPPIIPYKLGCLGTPLPELPSVHTPIETRCRGGLEASQSTCPTGPLGHLQSIRQTSTSFQTSKAVF